MINELVDGSYQAKILKDSMSPDNVRLTTFEITYPRFVHSELMTHRIFSRNSASSRALPISKVIERVKTNPVLPVWWGKNQSGMQAYEEFNSSDQSELIERWLYARDNAVKDAEILLHRGVHKQLVNRLLEPWMWITVLVTATEWQNFFALRAHPDAQPEIRKIAEMMKELYEKNAHLCDHLKYNEWHLPLTNPLEPKALLAEGFTIEQIKKISAGRSARVSYLTHDGKRDPMADIELCDRLRVSGHMSPLEHVARPMTKKEIKLYSSKAHKLQTNKLPFCGNFCGWVQFRKEIPNEDNFGMMKV